jgi:hypothetical protein
MKLNPQTYFERRMERQREWHYWFAWYPVWLDAYPELKDNDRADPNEIEDPRRLGRGNHGIHRLRGQRVWLEWVQRRAHFWVAIDYVTCCTWHYKQ